MKTTRKNSKKVNIWKMSDTELKSIIKEALDDFVDHNGKIWEGKTSWKLAL